MALRLLHLFPSKQPTKFHFHNHHSFLTSISTTILPKPHIGCSKADTRIRDLELAIDFNRKVQKLSDEFDKRQEALDKSTQILVNHLCDYLGLGTDDEFIKKWRQLDEDGKLGLVKGFVSEWGADFHPLSARSVKELVDDYCEVDTSFFSPISSPALGLFNGLKKILGFHDKD